MFQRRQPVLPSVYRVMATAAFCDHVFIRRLSELHVLSLADKRALLDLLGSPRRVAKGGDIVVDGSATTFA
jgi:hypothetical protein